MFNFKQIYPWAVVLMVFSFVVAISSCEKWEDKKAEQDPRLQDRKYCNDPEAVNYNWNFPGVPDNTVCFYPSDLFTGTFLYTDSVYSSNNVFDSAGSLNTYTLFITPLSKNKFVIKGFCPTDSLKFTAGRSTYMAISDSLLKVNDSTFLPGQFLCRINDTLTGTITNNKNDSLDNLYINWTVVSDTGVNYHRGTAIKQ